MKAILPRAGLFLCILCPLLALPTAGAACTQTQAGITVDLKIHNDTNGSDEQVIYTWGITFSAEEDYIADAFFQKPAGARVSDVSVMPADSDWFFYPGTFLFLPPFFFLDGIQFVWMEAGTPLQQGRRFEFSYKTGLQDPLRVYVTSFDGAIFDATFEPGLCVDLPVVLARFEALQDDEAVLLRWTTASETAHAGFGVQHARADAAFQEMAFIEAYGTSATPARYSYRTNDLPPGTHRFRLKMVGRDGAFSYSPVVEVTLLLPGIARLSAAYPNPFYPATCFTLTVARTQHVRVEVFDVRGRCVTTLYDGELTAGEPHPFTLRAEDLPSGLYLYRALGEHFARTRQVLLLK